MIQDPKNCADRITQYLTGGGLFNPELAKHDAVRDLLMDCRETLTQNTSVLSTHQEPIKFYTYAFGQTSGQHVELGEFTVAVERIVTPFLFHAGCCSGELRESTPLDMVTVRGRKFQVRVVFGVRCVALPPDLVAEIQTQHQCPACGTKRPDVGVFKPAP